MAGARPDFSRDLIQCYCFLCFSWHPVLRGEAMAGPRAPFSLSFCWAASRRAGAMLRDYHLISFTISATIRSCTNAARG